MLERQLLRQAHEAGSLNTEHQEYNTVLPDRIIPMREWAFVAGQLHLLWQIIIIIIIIIIISAFYKNASHMYREDS